MSSATEAGRWLPPRKRHRGYEVTNPTEIPTAELPGVVGGIPRRAGLRFTSQHAQQLLEQNAALMARWVHLKESTGTAPTVPSTLQRNLSILSAAALHDGADEFFPMRPGNVEVGGYGIAEPPRSMSKKTPENDAIFRILSELQGGKYATGKQFRNAVAVALLRLTKVSGNDTPSQAHNHVRDILLRILSLDLMVPRTQKGVMGLLSTLIMDLGNGPLSIDKYRKRFGRLPTPGDPEPRAPASSDARPTNAVASSNAAAPASPKSPDENQHAKPGDRKKWPFVMNGANGKMDMVVKVWVPETMAQVLEGKAK